MTGRVVIVTGADRGIGYETARYLAAEGGYDVVLACRDEDKGKIAVDRIKQENPSALATFMELDVSSLSSIKKFAENFQRKKRRLNILINNAAVKLSSDDCTLKLTRDKHEITMATNHIGPMYLTYKLSDLLITAAQMTGCARIINVNCQQHDSERLHVKELDVDNFQLDKKGTFNGLQAYKNSKLCNLLFNYHIADELRDTGVTVNAVNPGQCPGTALDDKSNRVERGLKLCCLHYLLRCAKVTNTKRHAGKELALLATSDKLKTATGCYFENGVSERSSIESYDKELREKVMNISKKLTGLDKGDGLDEISLNDNL